MLHFLLDKFRVALEELSTGTQDSSHSHALLSQLDQHMFSEETTPLSLGSFISEPPEDLGLQALAHTLGLSQNATSLLRKSLAEINARTPKEIITFTDLIIFSRLSEKKTRSDDESDEVLGNFCDYLLSTRNERSLDVSLRETFSWLWDKASAAQQQAMLEAYDYQAFRFACGSGHLQTVDWLWHKVDASQQQAMLKIYGYQAFRSACENGHLQTVDSLWHKADASQQAAMLKADDYYAFRFACRSDQLQTVDWLWHKADASQQAAMLKADDYYAFRFACRSGHLQTVDWLWH